MAGNLNSVDDPNSVSLFDLSCKGLGAAISEVPFAEYAVDVICGRVLAREDYLKIYPLLMENVDLKTPSTRTVLYLCEQIIRTAEFGACRQNFRRHYIDGKNSGPLKNPQTALIKKLPQDPKNITFGYWASQF
ncbi:MULTISPECIES: hypothetical protein [Stappiaceae]|uniref:hypothetical protein n=1 Tax=Stappiaceae TaxID=2821832 RepID=UPI00094B66BD|nr:MULTISPECIES: hypothetical protein [Stappiaceae]NKX63489.1 hypothetical protein [Labrenzia sp. 5N]QFT65711.1 hypothetical protein FIU93_02895 [Labrenzia sp. THAF35]UFI04897.1 hypothetical protein ST40_007170 [Roseibium aggregatum]WJS02475.1 hypothetical protein QUB73_25435 [Roseibium aggregatum]